MFFSFFGKTTPGGRFSEKGKITRQKGEARKDRVSLLRRARRSRRGSRPDWDVSEHLKVRFQANSQFFFMAILEKGVGKIFLSALFFFLRAEDII